MQDNQKKYRKKYAVMTVFFLISASFLFGCGNKDSAVPETEEFLFSPVYILIKMTFFSNDDIT